MDHVDGRRRDHLDITPHRVLVIGIVMRDLP